MILVDFNLKLSFIVENRNDCLSNIFYLFFQFQKQLINLYICSNLLSIGNHLYSLPAILCMRKNQI
jgi:hypothetical protein